jgi:uncharacterized YigZ family protein
MDIDSYISIDKESEGLFKDKGSKFISFIYPINSEDHAKERLMELKKKYHDARHHCYAYRIGPSEDRYRVYDDGEPSGTAGKPIFGQINSNNLSDVLIVVVRYFGGVLLGTSGLINAYKMAAIDCIQNAQLVERIVKKELVINFTYDIMSAVMRVVKDNNLEVIEQDFKETCRLRLNIRLSDYVFISEKYQDIYGVIISNS